MTTPLTLSAEERKKGKGKNHLLRKDGRIPAVLYGRGLDSEALSVSFLEFSRIYSQAGENTIIELALSSGKKSSVLIYDVAIDPLSGRYIHADFYQVRMDEEIEANSPLMFIGEAPAVKALGGVLVKALDEVGVSCLPAALPHELSVDISALTTFDDQIRVSDVVVPEGVRVTDDPQTVVALVERPRSDEEMAALDSKIEADVTKIEGVVKETPASEEKSA